MATDKEFIISRLNRDYKVYGTSGGFMHSRYQCNDWTTKFDLYHFILIFGDYKIDENTRSGDVFKAWVDEKVDAIEGKIKPYLLAMHESEGLEFLLEKALAFFSDDETITPPFIAFKFHQYCAEKYVKPKIEKYFEWLDFSKNFETLQTELRDVFVAAGYKYHYSVVNECFITLYRNKYLFPRVDAFFATLDLEKSLEVLVVELGQGLSDLLHFSDAIKARFNMYYHNTHVIPIVDFYLNSVDMNQTSQEIIDEVETKNMFTHLSTKELLEEHINKWYSIKKTLPFMNDFLSQLVIMSRQYDWLVKWIGHGQVTSYTVAELMKKENTYQRDFAEGMYDDWFGEKVLTAAEKMPVVNQTLDLTARGADAREIEEFMRSFDDDLVDSE